MDLLWFFFDLYSPTLLRGVGQKNLSNGLVAEHCSVRFGSFAKQYDQAKIIITYLISLRRGDVIVIYNLSVLTEKKIQFRSIPNKNSMKLSCYLVFQKSLAVCQLLSVILANLFKQSNALSVVFSDYNLPLWVSILIIKMLILIRSPTHDFVQSCEFF